jgi:hypothetical protein
MFGDLVSSLLAQVTNAAHAAADVGLPAHQALTLGLTAESLLFAAFAVSYNLAQPTDEGRSAFYAQGCFSFTIVLAITAVAISAGASWYALFQHDWPSGWNEWMRVSAPGEN